MKNKIVGALLLLLIGLGATYVAYLVWPHLQEREQKTSSDAVKTKGKIRVAVDNWIGYFPLRSGEMKSRMRRLGWLLDCEDDNADYQQRMKRLKEGELDFAVATVDSYLLNAKEFDYPGLIIAVLDESKGGDAILARKERVASLDALKAMSDVKVAFTPGSPSHYLAKATADHFQVAQILPVAKLRVETGGSEEARTKLLAGKVDVAVLWEPDVSKALEHEGIIKLLGTEDTERLIVDILLVRRQFAQKNPEVVQQLLTTYFKVLKLYRDNEETLVKDLEKETGLAKEQIGVMLKGVRWVSFQENCEKWYGIAAPGGYGEEGLLNTMESTVAILMNAGDFAANPIPDEDPYRLTNSSFLEEMFTQTVSGFTVAGAKGSGKGSGGVVDSLATPFAALDAAGWEALREVGTLKVEPIVFQAGASEFTILAKQVIDQAVERLRHYPNFRVVIKGHTGTRGDAAENLKLSQERAEAVARYLEVTYGVDANRLRPLGHGGEQPLAMAPGESRRTYEYRLPRVELVLVREEF